MQPMARIRNQNFNFIWGISGFLQNCVFFVQVHQIILDDRLKTHKVFFSACVSGALKKIFAVYARGFYVSSANIYIFARALVHGCNAPFKLINGRQRVR